MLCLEMAVSPMEQETLKSVYRHAGPEGVARSGDLAEALAVSPATITLGESATLSWNSNAPNCTASGAWNGPKSGDGSESSEGEIVQHADGSYVVSGTHDYEKFGDFTALRDVSLDDTIAQALKDHWFRFPEVRQNWLGFSKTGNKGSGLGGDFAEVLQRNLHNVFHRAGLTEQEVRSLRGVIASLSRAHERGK